MLVGEISDTTKKLINNGLTIVRLIKHKISASTEIQSQPNKFRDDDLTPRM